MIMAKDRQISIGEYKLIAKGNAGELQGPCNVTIDSLLTYHESCDVHRYPLKSLKFQDISFTMVSDIPDTQKTELLRTEARKLCDILG